MRSIERKRVNVRVINASWGSTSLFESARRRIRAAVEQGFFSSRLAGNNGTTTIDLRLPVEL